MASKQALLGGSQVKVENRSGFDKSRFHALTAPLGAIVPMVKQLLIPGSFDLRISLSAQLPPLASDAFLRSHLKVEAFFVPLRICYGGFQSWFSGEKVTSTSSGSAVLSQAKLPRLTFLGGRKDSDNVNHPSRSSSVNLSFGVHSLMDYFGVHYPLTNGAPVVPFSDVSTVGDSHQRSFNVFPFLAYQRICDEWYRNKNIERPYFCPPAHDSVMATDRPCFAPFVSFVTIHDYCYDLTDLNANSIQLLNGNLLTLRHRNYGYDYFTTALPSAQEGSPMSVDTSVGSFTISALRLANYAQHFSELNQIAGPDYRAVNKARYGVEPSAVVVSRPVLLGSADFPMFTSGVEQTAQGSAASGNSQNPFAGMGARYGRAHAEGSDFVCKGSVDEPGYLMVMVSLVPEANYAVGIAKDMEIFTKEGSIADLPCSQLELAGFEPIYSSELGYDDGNSPSRSVFGYQPRYMWHKAGSLNQVSGLFRQGASLESFVPQRLSHNGSYFSSIDSGFLKVDPKDLDNVTAVSASVSDFGVLIDSRVDLRVSEPLSESSLPSLVDPAYEHGRDVYLKRGGNSL